MKDLETAIIGLAFCVLLSITAGVAFSMSNTHQCRLEAIKAKLPAAEILLICR